MGPHGVGTHAAAHEAPSYGGDLIRYRTSAAVIGCLTCLLGPASAHATTYAPTRFDDPVPGACTPADCSLREAVVAANDSSLEADTIRLRAGTYRLTQSAGGQPAETDDLGGDLDLGDHGLGSHGRLTVAGAGARSTTVAGTAESSHRVFEVESSDEAELRDLTVTGGRLDNSSPGGTTQGAGIGVEGTGPPDEGGDATLVVRRVTVRGNRVVNGDGGGIDNNGALTALGSTVSGNVALNGGGVEQDDTLLLENSTISGNAVEEEGGGIDNDGGNVEFPTTNTERLTSRSSTIAFNTARRVRPELPSGSGGGISNQSTTGPRDGLATFRSTIVANNVADTADNCDHGGPSSHSSEGANLETTGECSFEHQNADARLGPLANNLGQTNTHALYEGSRAIDRGFGCPPRDQRGVARTDLSGCDIGAFESRIGYPGDPCSAPQPTVSGTARGDVLRGTPGPDVIFGGKGDDRIEAAGSDDVVCAGPGRDLVRAGTGEDRVDGSSDPDRLYGGAGADRLEGLSGDDKLFGESGPDSLFGEAGNDRLDGGSSADVCRDSAGRNTKLRCER